jgi:hypothetical protein
VKLKLAPSPPLTYSDPSGPKWRSPIEWLGYCWHQPSTSTCSDVETFPCTVRRARRPLTTQPSVVGPGGVGQASFHVGAVPPIGASYVYRT